MRSTVALGVSMQMKPFTVAYLLRDCFRKMSVFAVRRSFIPFAFDRESHDLLGRYARREREASSVAIIHTTQLPLLFISGLGFGPRFRASGFALLWAATSSTPWCVLPELHNCTHLCKLQQFELRSFKFKLLFIANATRSRSTFGGNHGGVPHGPRPETEARNDRIVAKIRTPFRASERAPFPTPRIFATLCQISGLGANSF